MDLFTACKHNIQIRPFLPPQRTKSTVTWRVLHVLLYCCYVGILQMFGTYLSNIKQVNSVSLLILSLSFSARKAESQTEIHCLSGTRIMHLLFHLTRTLISSLHCNIRICNFLQIEWRPVVLCFIHSKPHVCTYLPTLPIFTGLSWCPPDFHFSCFSSNFL